MNPSVLEAVCQGYEHLPCLLEIARSGVRVPVSRELPRQTTRPPNHKSAADRYNILVKNIHKEQDAWRCIVVDADILEIWPEVHISAFGVVDKDSEDPRTTGRVIHDLSYSVNDSLNDVTDQTAVCPPRYKHCDAIATEIVRQQIQLPDCEVKEQAGDVAFAYRHVCIHSHCTHKIGGRLHRDNALVIDMPAAFGWSGSPGNYGVVGGAISFIHSHTVNEFNPQGFFSYHWVDDHINVGADIGSNYRDMELSLRHAMLTVLGPAVINKDKFTGWSTRQKALGLIFDSAAGTVSMPLVKVTKAVTIVSSALHSATLRCSKYRSLLGSLRHVAIRHEGWWLVILKSSPLNGVPLTFYNTLPAADVIVEMDASDAGLCAIIRRDKLALTYAFTEQERQLITQSKTQFSIGFDINYRGLLSCAFAVHMWAASWKTLHRQRGGGAPLHIHFRIDNTSAASWQTKMASCNHRAQIGIRLLSMWETQWKSRFSSSHVAGVDNVIADAGSRSSTFSLISANLFNALTLGWTKVSPTITSADLTTIWASISEPTRSP